MVWVTDFGKMRFCFANQKRNDDTHGGIEILKGSTLKKLLIHQEKYDALVRIQREADPNFDGTSHYFPLYRG